MQWFLNGKPNGRYEGEFRDGKRNGRGVITFASGARYEGEFRDDKRNGRGVITFASGARYEGEFRDDKFNGRGVYTSANGDRYDGEHRDDKLNGRGVITSANGNRYEGEFRDGKRNGRGVITFANGDRYEGEFRDDNRNGRGVYTYADGNRYDGEHRDDKRNGRGVITFANGNRYEGEFRNGKPNGYGVFTFANALYRGQWVNGCYRDADNRVAWVDATEQDCRSQSLPANPSPPVAPTSDPLVVSTQTLLAALGYDPGPPDGFAGPKTGAAITAFQEKIGAKPDGKPSEALRARLQSALAERGPSISPPVKQTDKPSEAPKAETKLVSSGTGFFISGDTIISNNHVVEGCKEIIVGKRGAEIGSAKIIATSRGDDLAALRAEKPSELFLKLRIGTPVKAAEAVLVFGYPLAGALASSGNTTLGNITALAGLLDDSRFIQISASVQPGNSGGPVLDEAGRLIGVIEGKLDALKVARVTVSTPE